MSEALLRAAAVRRTYAMGSARLEVLRGCDLRVAPGEFVAIMGKSGSGKSTLLQILGALDAPDGGEVLFAGRPVFAPRGGLERVAAPLDRVLAVVQRVLVVGLTALLVLLLGVLPVGLLGFPWLLHRYPAALRPALYGLFIVVAVLAGWVLLLVAVLVVRLVLVHVGERHRVRLRRRDFGFVFQFYHLLPELNVLENVLLARQVSSSTPGWPSRRGAARQDALTVLNRVGLSERLTHRPSELSGGERQRVAIARALVHRPRILFADEPTGNLDAVAGGALMTLLRQLHVEGQTIVMVTHDPGIAAQADRVLILENGQLRQK